MSIKTYADKDIQSTLISQERLQARVREMGAEIVPYHLIDEIYESVERQDIVLDYIDQCNAIFRKFGVTPRIPDYPDVFKEFMGRRVWRDTINSIANDVHEVLPAACCLVCRQRAARNVQRGIFINGIAEGVIGCL